MSNVSFTAQTVSFQAFGFGASMTNNFMTGISSAGADSAQILSFYRGFESSQVAASNTQQFASKLSFASEFAPVPAPKPQYAGTPAGKGLATDPPGWPSGAVRTAGGYTVVPEGGTKWKIYNPGSKPGGTADTYIHGDPHVTEKDGGRWDFTKNSDFVLPDGTRINAVTSSETGRSVTTGLEITNGADHVSVTGVNGKPTTSPVKHDGYEWRAGHMASNPNRDSFVLGGDGDDWFLKKQGRNLGEIKGAHYDPKSQTYQQEFDGKPYRIDDPSLLPHPYSDAWGNKVRGEMLDFATGRMGMDPWSAQMVGMGFHQDHAMTQIHNNMARYAAHTGPFGGWYGMAFGFNGAWDALNGMADGMESLRALQEMQLGLRGAFLY